MKPEIAQTERYQEYHGYHMYHRPRRNILKKLVVLVVLLVLVVPLSPVLAASLPSSTNFKIQEYSFGAGGVQNASSTNFKLNGIAGEVEFGRPSSTNFKVGSGLTFLMKSNVPPAPAFTNPSNYYNKLNIVLNTGNNATDAQFAISIQNSGDSFATTKYVQADHTLGSTMIWQSISTWGAGGFDIIGLTPGITYRASVAARQGNFTQSEFGPTVDQATVNPTLSFTLSPNSVNIGSLTPATVITAPSSVTSTVSTNGTGGAIIYTYDNNSGLLSSSVSYTISAVSNDLSSISEGYGLRSTSTTQASGGPMRSLSPYNSVTTTVVGLLDTNKRIIFDSTNQPVSSGQGIFELKAKASVTAKAANDYGDIITVIASATF